MPMPSEIFLSHSSLDEAFVTPLAGTLQRHGVPTWYSKTNILGAQQWQDEIGAALKRCDWFAIVLSPNAVDPKAIWVKRELQYALMQKRFVDRIVAIVYQRCDFESLSWVLPTVQLVDFQQALDSGYRDRCAFGASASNQNSNILMIETDRLLLREFTLDDADAYYALGADPAIIRYTHAPAMTSIEHAREVLRTRPIADYRKHGFGRWACVLKSSSQVIGFAGLKYLDDLKEVDIGYRLLPAHWGKGLATEACRPVLRHGFDVLNLESIIGLVMPENVASVRVLEKLGLTFTGMIDYQSESVARYVIHASKEPRTE